MVFTSIIQWVRSRGPDEFWRKRRIFKLTAHYRSRPRNCYSLAVRNAHRALVYATKGRQVRRDDRRTLWEQRIGAGARESDLTQWSMREGLMRQNVMIDRKSLADLSIWEGRTFSALAAIADYTMRQTPEMDPAVIRRHDAPPSPTTFEILFGPKK